MFSQDVDRYRPVSHVLLQVGRVGDTDAVCEELGDTDGTAVTVLVVDALSDLEIDELVVRLVLADGDELSLVDNDGLVPVDVDMLALGDNDGLVLVDVDVLALVDNDGLVLVDVDVLALVDNDGLVLVEVDVLSLGEVVGLSWMHSVHPSRLNHPGAQATAVPEELPFTGQMYPALQFSQDDQPAWLNLPAGQMFWVVVNELLEQ